MESLDMAFVFLVYVALFMLDIVCHLAEDAMT